jgi:hypothetical protein
MLPRLFAFHLFIAWHYYVSVICILQVKPFRSIEIQALIAKMQAVDKEGVEKRGAPIPNMQPVQYYLLGIITVS